MQHSTLFIFCILLGNVPFVWSYDPANVTNWQTASCFQDSVDIIFKFLQISTVLINKCTNPPKMYVELESLKSNLAESTTALKADVEMLIPCLEIPGNISIVRVQEPIKKMLQDANTTLSSLLEDIENSTNISDLCKCFRDGLESVMDILIQSFTELTTFIPPYFWDILSGLDELVFGLLSSGSYRESMFAELQENFTLAIEKIYSGLHAAIRDLNEFSLKNPDLETLMKMLINMVSSAFNTVGSYIVKLKDTKTIAEMKLVLDDFVAQMF